MMCFCLTIYSQEEICTDDAKPQIIDVNKLTANKCAVDLPKRKTKQKTSKNYQPKRFLKKRTLAKQQTASNMQPNNVVNFNETGIVNQQLEMVRTLIEKETIKTSKEEVVSFTEVEIIPQFPDCKHENTDAFDCFNFEMSKHINTHLNYPEEAIADEIEGEVWISFIINQDGKVSQVKTTAPKNAKLLEKEARRIVKLLPQFIPGKQQGIQKSVSYSFPMSFTLQGE